MIVPQGGKKAVLESFSTMFRVLTQPGEVYARVRDRSPVLWPMVLVGVAGLVSGLMLVPALENMLQEQLVVEPDLPAEAAEIGVRVGIWASVAGSAVGPLLSVVVTGGVLSFGSMLTGGSLPFRRALSLTLFAYVPLLVRGLLLGGLVLSGAVTQVTTAATSAALLLSPESAGTLSYRLLSLLDPLEWWHVALLAGGVRAVGGTRPRAAWTLAVVVWVLLYASFKLLTPAL
jgi:hypothetical protein